MSRESIVVHQCLRDALSTPQHLAPLPRICAELAQLTADQVVDASQLAHLVETDAALAGEVMRVANSPAMRPRAPLVSLRQAVSWLGVAEVRNIAIAVMLRGDVFVAPGHEVEANGLWREAWLAGLWAKEIARHRRKHVESAFLAALMHRAGAALALKILAGYEVEQGTAMDGHVFAEMTIEFEPAFGRLLMSDWNMPADVQAAASDWRHYPSSPHADLAGTVNAAHLLAAHTLNPEWPGETVVLEDPVFERLGIFPDERVTILGRLDHVLSLAGG